MIINDIQGDLFGALEPGDSIAHGANCKGLMGAGVAAPIHDRYPLNYAVYRFLCDSGKFVPGDCLVVPDGEHTVFNLATQYYPGPDAQYEYIRKAAFNMYWQAVNRGITKIKTVRMGAGIGGLDWDRVADILRDTGDDSIVLDVYYF